MKTARRKLGTYAKYAWFVLGFNVLVILWGVFLRASKSGDGCGQHWLTCHGEVIPSAPELKTLIEFTHRVTSAVAFFLVLALLIWTFRNFRKGQAIRRTAALSFIFIVTEALVGAGLVLTGNTAETLTAARPFWAAGHLLNTFILLAFLTLTARFASGGRPLNTAMATPKYLGALAVTVLVVLVIGLTGSIAALASMLFPSGTLAEGAAKDLSATSHGLLRLRLLHPISAILGTVFIIFVTSWMAKESGKDQSTSRWANSVALLLLAQLALGAATLLTMAPIVMQLGHLLLADAVWIALVLFAANFLSSHPGTTMSDAPEDSGLAEA
jgi:heme A synthase